MRDNAWAGQLESLLREEREVLLSGRLEHLSRIEESRNGLMAQRPDGFDDAARLQHLRRLAARNAAIAGAAREGVQAAMTRLSEIQAAAGPIEGYSASGQRKSIGARKPIVERKA